MRMALVPLLVAIYLHGASGINISKRSDDSGPLEDVVMHLTTELNKLQAKQTAQDQLQTQLLSEVDALKDRLAKEEQHAAFLAQIVGKNVTTPGTGPIIYNHVVFNDGRSYDPHLGVFTAPYPGVFIFTTQFYTHGTQQSRPVLDLLLNRNPLLRMAFDSQGSPSGYEQDSHATSITVRLKAGDKVWVASAFHTEFDIFGSVHTFFSGALLYSE